MYGLLPNAQLAVLPSHAPRRDTVEAGPGVAVLVGGFGRASLPRDHLAPLASYDVPGLFSLQGTDTKRTIVWTLLNRTDTSEPAL